MEDFSTRTYGTSGLDNRPLFGETSAKVSAAPDAGPEWRVCPTPRPWDPEPCWVLLRPLEGTCSEIPLHPSQDTCLAPRLPLWDRVGQEPLKIEGGEKFRKFWAVRGPKRSAEARSLPRLPAGWSGCLHIRLSTWRADFQEASEASVRAQEWCL